ncbi:MAG: hypothetical protein JO347_07120 [Candidatus Eremiobacteraeota bacterium]|nr:hypothetical protein [Candidatus Eremiobacteraeota bacterium]
MRVAALVACLAVAGCAASQAVPTPQTVAAAPNAGLHTHAIIGFSVDTPERAATAAREGVDTTILYDGSPPPGSALARALHGHGIAVVDGSVSGLMFYWECHRTHTVKPPPKSYGYNPYCRTDEDPHLGTEAAVLRALAKILEHDAARPYVVGYWVLDDWAWWDPGSGRRLLQKVHALIAARTPGRPAICGFGGGVGPPGKVFWDPGTGANYSNSGCDVVGWYNYSPFGLRHPSLGKKLDWTMKALLPAMHRSLAKRGWRIEQTPLYGIGQGWGGSYEHHFYQPGLTQSEVVAQASAFCRFGARYVGWYAWDDSGFESRTHTPNNSDAIGDGMLAGAAACRAIWNSR